MNEARPSCEEIERAGEVAQSYRRRQAHARSPEERMKLFEQIQTEAFETMRSNPAAYQAFVKRNHHLRRESNVRKLEAEMRPADPGCTDPARTDGRCDE